MKRYFHNLSSEERLEILGYTMGKKISHVLNHSNEVYAEHDKALAMLMGDLFSGKISVDEYHDRLEVLESGFLRG